MSEADEVAESLRPMFVAVVKPQNRNMDMARRFVREWTSDVGTVMEDNIAAALIRKDREAEQIRREKHEPQT